MMPMPPLAENYAGRKASPLTFTPDLFALDHVLIPFTVSWTKIKAAPMVVKNNTDPPSLSPNRNSQSKSVFVRI
jgi:hypothetical protein